jgi:peptidoglycan/xylan/chitin deacetylase (PgdA/CDA1 family)
MPRETSDRRQATRRRLSAGLAITAVAAVAAEPPRAEPVPVRAEVVLARLARAGALVFSGGRRGREVALTFDDGPGPYTALALRILRGEAQATFFDVG